MKKRTLKLKKESITELNRTLSSKIKGGESIEQDLVAFTDGCTDRCTTFPTIYTHFNCTDVGGHCTRDCPSALETQLHCR